MLTTVTTEDSKNAITSPAGLTFIMHVPNSEANQKIHFRKAGSNDNLEAVINFTALHEFYRIEKELPLAKKFDDVEYDESTREFSGTINLQKARIGYDEFGKIKGVFRYERKYKYRMKFDEDFDYVTEGEISTYNVDIQSDRWAKSPHPIGRLNKKGTQYDRHPMSTEETELVERLINSHLENVADEEQLSSVI